MRLPIRNIVALAAGLVSISLVGALPGSADDTTPSVSASPALTAKAFLVLAENGELDALRASLDTLPELIKSTDERGYTALHLAACPGCKGNFRVNQDYTAAVELLLERGIDANIRSKDGITPLLALAVYRIPRSAGIAKVMVDGLPYPEHLPRMQLKSLDSLLSHKADVNAASNSGLTPLHVAAMRGHVDMVKALLDKGANPKARTKAGKTPRQLAEEEGNEEILALLPSS